MPSYLPEMYGDEMGQRVCRNYVASPFNTMFTLCFIQYNPIISVF